MKKFLVTYKDFIFNIALLVEKRKILNDTQYAKLIKNLHKHFKNINKIIEKKGVKKWKK